MTSELFLLAVFLVVLCLFWVQRTQLNPSVLTKDDLDIERKLMMLLADDVLIASTPEGHSNVWFMAVGCTGVFKEATDIQIVTFSDLFDLFDYWAKDRKLGPLAWVTKTRRMPPLNKNIFIGSPWVLEELLKETKENV
jgi:hypothetical protein